MRPIILIFAVALAGCAGQVEPEPRTVRVEVLVAVPCRVPVVEVEVEVPVWATAGLRKGDDLQTKVRALLAVASAADRLRGADPGCEPGVQIAKGPPERAFLCLFGS